MTQEMPAALMAIGRVLPGGAAAEVFIRHHNVAGLYLVDELPVDILHAVRRQLRVRRRCSGTGRG